MRLRPFRFVLAGIPILTLLVFFIPWIPAVVFPCAYNGLVCLTNPNGLQSIGVWAFHWGAFFSFEEGYFSPLVSSLTTFGVVLFVVVPLAAVSVVLLSPEVVSVIHKVELEDESEETLVD